MISFGKGRRRNRSLLATIHLVIRDLLLYNCDTSYAPFLAILVQSLLATDGIHSHFIARNYAR